MNETLETLKKRPAPPWLLAAALVLIGSILRVIANDVAAYSPADEAHYIDITRWLSREGLTAYPKFVSTYLEQQTLWLSPTPLRWGYFSLTTLACSVRSPCDGRTIAWLSTLAGIVSLVLTYALGNRLVGRSAALVATALAVCSPLQLALGRRALQDEVYCAAVLAALYMLTRVLDLTPQDPSPWKRWLGFVATSTLAFSIKEAFVFPYAAFVLLYFLAAPHSASKRSDAARFLIPPLAYVAGFLLLGQNLSALYEFARLHEASFASDYSIRYQSGPAHRPLFDLFLLAPIVCVLATAAIAKMTERLRDGGPERWLGGFLILTLAAFMGLPKNLRFVVILDPVLRLLAAWVIVHHPWVGRASLASKAALYSVLLVLNAAVELSLFDTVFRQRNVYDPTTYDLLDALGAIPGAFLPRASNMSALTGGLAFVGASAILLGLWRAAMTEKNEGNERATRLSPPMLMALGVVGLVGAFFAGRFTAPGNISPTNATEAQAPSVAVTNIAPGKPARDPMAEGLDALYTQKDPARAVARFREVLAADPNHYGATYQLASALEQAGDLPAARAMWAKMVTMAEANRDEATLAHARTRMAALIAPPPAAAAAVVEDPMAEPMRLGLAELYEKKNPVGATKYFRDVLAKNPTHYGATYQLAAALEQAGKRDEAKPYWKKTLEMAQSMNDSKTAAIARKNLGQTPIFDSFH